MSQNRYSRLEKYFARLKNLYTIVISKGKKSYSNGNTQLNNV